MLSLQTITVGLSLTGNDVDILRYAAVVARLGVTRELRFVHVVASDGLTDRPFSPAEARDRLESLVSTHFEARDFDLSVSCHVVEGAGAESLANFVTQRDSELILLGRGRQVEPRNSPVHRLATAETCSIWTVPCIAPRRITRILAPVDFSENSADSLSQAAAISCLHGLDECLALKVNVPAIVCASDRPHEDEYGPTRQQFREFLKPVNTHGVDIVTRVIHDALTVPAILSYARQHAVDLIVLSTRGDGPGESDALGAVTSRVLLQSDIPVLAVRHYRGALSPEPSGGLEARPTRV